jgi:predicted TIM-barrel fold metal-dependent hydrolase
MSRILDAWRAGEGLPDTLVIDGHTHIMAWPHGANFAALDEAVAEATIVMDANGVDAACVLSGGYMAPGADYTLGNDALIEIARRAGDRFIGFAHVNPNDGVEGVMAELERVERAGLRCIKLLNSYQQGYPGDGPSLMALYRFAAERDMLVLNHSWTNDEIARIAGEFLSVDFICGHYGPARDAVLRDFPNVYTSIWNLAAMGFLERGVGAVGPEKFLFGSDAFMNPISVGIGLVVYADISDDAKRMILGLTQARLLDRVGALPRSIKDRHGI